MPVDSKIVLSVLVGVVVGMVGSLESAKSPNAAALIKKANLYYQSSAGAEPLEVPAGNVELLDSDAELKVIVHGFRASRNHASIKPLGNAYKAQGGQNILLADWEDAAHLDYPRSRKLVAKVAQHFGQILSDFLVRHAVAPTQVHVVGHSLGAHIAGDIGKYFNRSLGRVTGLDPALPLFTPHNADSLGAADALFVDVIHTDYPIFGDGTPRGTVDFYPNFGRTPQPGCDEIDFLTISKIVLESYSCSHNRAVTLYAESIGLPSNFPAISCSLNAIKQRSLDACLSGINGTALAALIASGGGGGGGGDDNGNTGVAYMGENVSRNATGYYFLETNEAPPFGKGLNTVF